MTGQTDLFTAVAEHGLARRTDPETSHAAAREAHTAQLEAAVVSALRVIGPSTSEQVAAYLGRDLVAVSPRFRPLATKGLIEDSGQRGTNRSGRRAILWRVR